MITAIDIQPAYQTGMNCKLTAIASIDMYYAASMGYTPMPLHKAGRHDILSIREVAKTNDSLQGEMLEISRLQKTLTDIGFDAEIVDFQSNPTLFKEKIRESLIAGDVPVIFFAVNTSTGLPESRFHNANEHAAIISGIDDVNDILELTHWEHRYRTNISDLYCSAMALPTSREVEYYEPAFDGEGKRDKVRKYEMIMFPATRNLSEPLIRHSITPEENTGFKAKLLIIKKPQLVKINACREELLLKCRPSVDKIINTTRKEQENHCNWKQFLANLAYILVSILTLGLANLFSYSLTGQYTFFKVKTESEKQMNGMQASVRLVG